MSVLPNDLDELHRQAKEHFLERLKASDIHPAPFPHFFTERVFPEPYYRLMLDLLPTRSAYRKWTDVGKVKLEQYSRRDQCYLEDSWLASQPEDQRSFWTGFGEWFLGPEVASAAMDLFRTDLEHRFDCAADEWPEVYTQAIFLRHRADYFIGPHTDIPSKVVNLLLYLPRDNTNEHLGTSLYVPKEKGFQDPGNRHYDFEDFECVETAPYRSNSALGFVKTLDSWHGVAPIDPASASQTPRDVIQYMIYDNPMRAPRKDQAQN